MTYLPVHQENDQLFYIETEGHKAYLLYDLKEGLFTILKVFVPQPIEGIGVAGTLVQTAYSFAIKRHYKVAAECTYAQRWLERYIND